MVDLKKINIKKYKKSSHPLLHKNFEGANMRYVFVRIVDIIDDYFVIEYQSGNYTTIKQSDFLDFYKSITFNS